MATIYNYNSNSLVSGTGNNDYIENWSSNVTVIGKDGFDTIWNGSNGNNTSISGGAGNDSILNGCLQVTISGGDGADTIWNGSDSNNTSINGGKGNDYIQNLVSNVTISVETGNDYIYNSGSTVTVSGGGDSDTIYNYFGDKTSINSGAGNDSIYNHVSSYVTISSGGGNDTIENLGENVTINCGDGNDSIGNGHYGSKLISNTSIDCGKGKDYISNLGSYVTISCGAGSDTLYNACQHLSNGSIYYYVDSLGYGANMLLQYSVGDGNDIIYGFRADSTLSISGTYSTTKSDDNIIVTVGKGKITLVGAASLSKVNIKGGKTPTPSPEKNSWKLSGTTATYGTSSKTLATINGAKSVKGLSVSGNKITLKNSALKNKVTVSGGYEFNFASDYKKATITGSKNADTITANGNNLLINGKAGNDTIKFFGTATTVKGGAGNDLFVYKSGNNVIADYEEEDKISIAGTAQVVTSGSDVIFTVGSNKLTVKGGKGKKISYVDATGEQTYSAVKEKPYKINSAGTAVTLSNAYSEEDFEVENAIASGSKIVTINASALTSGLNIMGNEESNYIIGGKGNDSIDGYSGNDTLSGGAGADTFIYYNGDGKDIITDYKEEDTVQINSDDEIVTPTTKGRDVVLKVGEGSITLKNAAKNKIGVTYVENEIEYNYLNGEQTVIMNEKKTYATVTKNYWKTGFDFANFGKSLQKADASAVTHALNVTGNDKANVILGGSGKNTLTGGTGNDTLQGGDKADVFIYNKGDGNDVILGYGESDIISIASGAVNNVTVKGDTVILTVGKGKISVDGAAGETNITYYDANGRTSKIFSKENTNVVEPLWFAENNFTEDNQLSAIVQSKAVDCSFLNVLTKLSKESDLITYADKK